ncbi:hypothetical protein GCM10012280_70910 [Wenjunlia tyrosinilytica]|uniref:Uncharacterized protein n=1 Tax=Wenjunlia tyrosinilytica TaxID=1544741 RepID=A0A917ZZU4_9ACTN|nr:hypothetical protein GCM10012280_70910 [Wenjunlia tyrosinilytica]
MADGDVPAYILGVGIVPIRGGVECAADLLDAAVADELVARARSEVEAESSGPGGAWGTAAGRSVDVQTDGRVAGSSVVVGQFAGLAA